MGSRSKDMEKEGDTKMEA
ncbi:hypothetical protein L195_g042948, partial [Trifolium pratense]